RPTHLDSHHHLHMSEPVAAVTAELADDLSVPLRGREIPYEASFFARRDGRRDLDLIGPGHLIDLIVSLPAGWTELGCHPGSGVGDDVSSYAEEREVELRTLCDARVAAAIAAQRVALRSFAEVPPERSLDSGGDGGL